MYCLAGAAAAPYGAAIQASGSVDFVRREGIDEGRPVSVSESKSAILFPHPHKAHIKLTCAQFVEQTVYMEKTLRGGKTVAHIEIRRCPLNVSTVFCFGYTRFAYMALTDYVDAHRAADGSSARMRTISTSSRKTAQALTSST